LRRYARPTGTTDVDTDVDDRLTTRGVEQHLMPYTPTRNSLDERTLPDVRKAIAL
jgi:hypothetical protein